MSQPFIASVVREGTPTSTGEQTYTVPGDGSDPKGFVLDCCLATSEDSLIDGWSESFATCDGIDANTRISYRWSRHNVSTSEARQGGDTDGPVLKLYDPSTNAVIVEANFVEFNGDEVVLDFVTVDSSAHRFIMSVFQGDDCECASFRDRATTAGNTVTVGFQTDLVISNVQLSNVGSFGNEAWWHCGVSTRPSINQTSMWFQSDHAVSTTKTERGKWATKVSRNTRITTPSDVVGADCKITTYTSTGFDLVNQDTSGNAMFIHGLAVKVGSSIGISGDGSRNTPASTGNETIVPGFKTGFALMVTSANSTENNLVENFGAGCMGYGVFNSEGSIAGQDAHNVSTTNSSSHAASAISHLFGHIGNLLAVANWTERTATDFVLNWSTVPGLARKYGIVFIELPDWEVEFAATQGAAVPTGWNVVQQAVQFEATQGAATAAVVVELEFRATFGATQGSPTAAVVAIQIFRATFGATLGPATASTFPALLIFRATIGATQAAAVPADWNVVQQAVQFVAIQAAALPIGWTAVVPVAPGSRTCLLGSDDRRVAFTGSYVLRSVFAGVYALRTELAGAFVVPSRTELVGSHDPRTDLAGSHAPRVGLSGAHDVRADLLGSYALRTALAGSYDRRTALAVAYPLRTELAGSYDLRTELTGERETC